MAKAKKVPEDYVVELTLTPDEAMVLRAVCGAVGGLLGGDRGKMESIDSVLGGCGVQRRRRYQGLLDLDKH